MESASDSPPLVYFDLETTDLDVRRESITQIAALCGDKLFDVYVKPTCPISRWSIENTHITFDCKEQQMYYKGERVHSKTPQEALRSLMSYLREFGKPVILVAHYGHLFDALILYHHLKRYNLWDKFVDLVIGFADTIPMFQRVKPDMFSYKLNILAANFLSEESYSSHNAIDDTRILKTLVEQEGDTNLLIKECIQSCSQIGKS